MKKLLIASVTALALAGCATVPGGTTPKPSTNIITQIQQAAVAACGFLPVASAVASALSGSNAGIATAEQIASVICGTVTSVSKSSRRGIVRRGSAVIYQGRIVGRFVR